MTAWKQFLPRFEKEYRSLAINGVINIYKEKGYTSFHVVYEIRRITGESKVGHTGTLDPDVTGVLPVCVGKATKLVGQLTDTDKTYRCRMRFGICTDTQDMTGQITKQMDAGQVQASLLSVDYHSPLPAGESMDSFPEYDAACDRIRKVLKSFVGEIEQIPPMYSALKVGGMKLVNAARKGVVVDRKARKVTIYGIDNIEVSLDLLHVSFTVRCSKGTYVRTLCEDIGHKLGLPSCMEELERVQAAGLTPGTAFTLEQVRELARDGKLDECVIPVDDFLKIYPALTVTDEAVKKLIYGNYLYREDVSGHPVNPAVLSCDGVFRIYDRQGFFYALYRYDKMADCYKCVKMFRDPDRPE